MRPNFKKCQWFTSNKRHFASKVLEDCMIRKLAIEFIGERLFADLSIERIGEQTNITLNTHKPGAVIGGKDKKVPVIEIYKKQLNDKVFHGKPFQVSLSEIFKPEINPNIVANNIAEQLELRMSTKSCMKKAMGYFLRSCPTGGIKIVCSGRVGGAEIARREKVQEGKMPLASIKADVSMAIAVAHTVYGTVSVRVYIYIPKDFVEFKKTSYGDRSREGDRKFSSNKFGGNKTGDRKFSKFPPRDLNKENTNKENTNVSVANEEKTVKGEV
jgi:small subunit ribosomal protein S3